MKILSSNRTVVLVLISLFLTAVSGGCIKQMARAQHNSTVSADKLQRLKEKTVVLILPQTEYKYIEEYRELIPKAWSLTPIEVIKYSEQNKYASKADKYAFFNIAGIKTTVTNNSSSYTNVHYYVVLSVPYAKPGKKGKIQTGTDDVCRIEMYPDFPATTARFNKNTSDVLYTTGEFRNFTLPYMMAYLRIVQKNLQQGKDPWVYENYSEASLRQRLARDTLYIPENTVFSRNKFSGKEAEIGEGFFEAYPGKYKIISTSDLITLIKNRNPAKPLFLFEYVLSSTDKYVGVLEINSGTIAYRKYTALSYNLKPKDIKDLY